MGNTQQLYGRLDMVMLDRHDKIYGSLGMHDSYLLNTVTGNPLTLTHSREGKMGDEVTDCKIYGWSKQFTTTGKNFINADEYYSQFKQSDGTYKAKTVTLNDIRISLSEFVGKEITLSVKLTVGANTSSVFLMYISPEQKKINGSTIKSGLTGKSILTVTPVSNTDYFVISFGSGNDDVTFSELQLEFGSVATSYEPYTGGKPSPSPEYTQEIESAGSDGKIGMEVRGKNLFDFSRLVSDGVNVMDYDNQTITVPAKTNNTGYNQTLRDLCPGITPGIYVFSMKRSNPNSGNGSYFLEAAKDFPTNTPIELTDELLDNHISWYNSDTSEVENVISEIQIEKGNAVTSYEPYHEPQSLSIQTPTGLPAIPVDTDGNYTDANGQQWIADYVDLKRGKYVQNVTTLELTGDEKFRYGTDSNTQNILGGLYTVTFALGNIINKMVISNAFVRATNNWTYKIEYVKEKKVSVFTLTNTQAVVFVLDATVFPTKEDFALFLKTKKDAGNPVVLYYNLSKPIERNLTPSEIQAYQELTTYAGTTIVENDADCYMECTYKASGNE